MEIVQKLKKDLKDGTPHQDLSRKVFLSYKTHVFKDQEDLEFVIKNRIKEHLNVPFISIQVTGSSKTGFSFFKQTCFTEGKSDLDISIVSNDLYNTFFEEMHVVTKGFTDLSVFPNIRGLNTDKQCIKNLKKGFADSTS